MRTSHCAHVEAANETPLARPGATCVGYLRLICQVAEQRYGLTSQALLDAAALDATTLREPSGLVPETSTWSLLRFVARRSGDPALGLHLAAAESLRNQGFWAYALASSCTVREYLERVARYAPLRASGRLALREEGAHTSLVPTLQDVPGDLAQLVLDQCVARICRAHRVWSPDASALEIWLDCAEQPHHRALRALSGGSMLFGAPCHQLRFSSSLLAQQLGGDAHLGALAVAQLEQALAHAERARGLGTLERVREQLDVRLATDASLARVASDLRVSARTLRRRLRAGGASFLALRDEARRLRALAYLDQTSLPVAAIAQRLGYDEPASFRRAFRRWTGLSPRAYRAQLTERSGAA